MTKCNQYFFPFHSWVGQSPFNILSFSVVPLAGCNVGGLLETMRPWHTPIFDDCGILYGLHCASLNQMESFGDLSGHIMIHHDK